MPIYDVNKIEDSYNDFIKCKEQFKNKEYDDFNSSYFCNCGETVIVRLRNKIKNIYSNINTGYSNIDKFWNEYIDDIKTTENSLQNGTNTSKGSNVSSILSKLNGFELAYDSFSISDTIKAYAAKNNVISSVETFIDDPIEGTKNLIKRTSATCINTTAAFYFGAMGFAEKLVDGAYILDSMTNCRSMVYVAKDVYTGITTGDWKFNNMTDYTNNILQKASVNYTEKLKDAVYSTKIGKYINDNSFEPFKRGNAAYSITEGLGELAGVTILNATGVGAVGTGFIYGMKAFGDSVTKNYNKKAGVYDDKGKIVSYNNLDAKTLSNITATGVLHGAIEGALVGVSRGGALEKLQKSSNRILNTIGNAAYNVNNLKYGQEITKGMMNTGVNFFKNTVINTTTNAAMDFSKTMLKEAVQDISNLDNINGQEVYNKEMWEQTLKKGAASAATSVIYDVGKAGKTIFSNKFDIDFDRFDPAKKIKVDTEKQAALRNVEVDKTSETATKYLIDAEKNLLKTQLKDKVEKTVNNVEDLIA